MAKDAIKISKIKAVQNNFAESGGPYDIITLGVKFGQDELILGTYYFGPYMNDEHGERCKRLEAFLDQIATKEPK